MKTAVGSDSGGRTVTGATTDGFTDFGATGSCAAAGASSDAEKGAASGAAVASGAGAGAASLSPAMSVIDPSNFIVSVGSGCKQCVQPLSTHTCVISSHVQCILIWQSLPPIHGLNSRQTDPNILATY